MILETNVPYRATVRLQGERSARLRIVSEPVPIEVEEHRGADVVCTWKAPLPNNWNGESEMHPTEVLAAGDAFYRVELDGRIASAKALRTALEGMGVTARPSLNDEYSLMEGVHRPAEIIDLSKAIVASIEPYDRRLRVGKVQERIGRYAIVDGRLCSRRSEPVLVAGTDGGGLPGRAHMQRIDRPLGRPTVTVAWSGDVNDGSKGRGVFRLDRLDEAVAFAAAYAGKMPDDVKVMASFDLLAPERLKIDDEMFAVGASARQAFRHLGGHLAALPRPVVDAAFDLRDMLAAPDVRLDFLRDALERVCENLRPIVGDPNVECDRHTLRQVLEEMDEANERLAASRPLSESVMRLVGP